MVLRQAGEVAMICISHWGIFEYGSPFRVSPRSFVFDPYSDTTTYNTYGAVSISREGNAEYVDGHLVPRRKTTEFIRHFGAA